MEPGVQAPTEDRHVIVNRVSEDDWRRLRDVRLAALLEAPAAFDSGFLREEVFDEDRWRAWARSAGLFIAYAGGSPVGMAGGVAGESSLERELVSMWVDPGWRSGEAAPKLVRSVIAWAESEGSERLRLWVAEGNASARRFYERLGFKITGGRRPLPSSPGVFKDEMVLELS